MLRSNLSCLKGGKGSPRAEEGGERRGARSRCLWGGGNPVCWVAWEKGKRGFLCVAGRTAATPSPVKREENPRWLSSEVRFRRPRIREGGGGFRINSGRQVQGERVRLPDRPRRRQAGVDQKGSYLDSASPLSGRGGERSNPSSVR